MTARKPATEGEASSAEPFIPKGTVSLAVLATAVQGCRGCAIYKCGTRAVMGEGAAGGIMLVGEQPGDVEEQRGRPFVGPAGQVLDKALEQAGIDRSRTFVTNAVKHFKFSEQRGKRRIHSKPSAREADACRPWLERELEIIKPRAVVALGATAAQSLMGRGFRITRDGGKIVRGSPWAPIFLATGHPSAILRKPSSEERRRALDALVHDLRLVAGALRGPAPGRGAQSRAAHPASDVRSARSAQMGGRP